MEFEYEGQSVQLAPEVKKYLRSIGNKLRLPKKIKQSVLSDLVTGMLARVEGGESMEQIIHEMGTPLQVAEGINEEMDDFVYIKSPWRWACLALVIICAIVLLMHGYWGVLLFLFNSMLDKIGGMEGPTQIFVTTTKVGQIQGMITPALLMIMGVLGFVQLSHCPKQKE